MKFRYIAFLSILMLVSGCGVFSHRQQTYYVRAIEPQNQTKPEFKVQIVPTEKNFHILFLVYSRKWIPPYSIRFSSYSKEKVDSHFTLHSFKLKSDGNLIEEKTFSPPKKLELTERKSGNHIYYKFDYRFELGESLQFEKGKEVELEVIYEHSEMTKPKMIRLKGIGEEQKNKTSLWDAYMSV